MTTIHWSSPEAAIGLESSLVDVFCLGGVTLFALEFYRTVAVGWAIRDKREKESSGLSDSTQQHGMSHNGSRALSSIQRNTRDQVAHAKQVCRDRNE